MYIRNDDLIFILLSYTPKEATLALKMGNLPIKFMKSCINNENDLQIFEGLVRQFNFGLDTVPISEPTSSTSKLFLTNKDNKSMEHTSEGKPNLIKKGLNLPQENSDSSTDSAWGSEFNVL